MMNKSVLTIAGSDSGGGAGIQADLKVMCAYGVYGMSVITAVTAQNTLGVQRVEEMSGEMVAAQLFSVLEDIRPDAVKLGMLFSRENVKAAAEAIERYRLENIVLDPVMLSSSGHKLLREDALEAMQELLFPRVTLVTPNVPEARRLADVYLPGKKEKDPVGWVERTAALFSARWQTSFLIKGGHLEDAPADYFYDGKQGRWFAGRRIRTRHTHGTGCTLSTAIACNLPRGLSVEEAIEEGKEYLTGCILHNPALGHGHGPLNHLWRMEEGKACIEAEKNGCI